MTHSNPRRPTKEDILWALADPELPQDEDVQVLRAEIHLQVDPRKWHIVGLEVRRDIALVSDGRMAGLTPVNADPDITWECPHCGSYGPWSGVICLTCMHRSDPND